VGLVVERTISAAGTRRDAWENRIPLIVSGSVKPIVERVYPFGEASEALRHLIEDQG
jgi:NADPH:quinone reductase